MQKIEQPRWKTVEYSRTKIVKAGKTVKSVKATEEELREAHTIIDNWRATHAFPLHIFYMYLRRLAGGRDNIIVAERFVNLLLVVIL